MLVFNVMERESGLTPWIKGEISERRFLEAGDRLYDLSKLNDVGSRYIAAMEIRDAAFESLSQNRLVHFESLTNEDIENDPKLAEKFFTGFRPEGRLLGLFHLVYNAKPKERLTVSVFESPSFDLLIHRTAPQEWNMYYDGASAVVAAVASAVIYAPGNDISITDTGEAPDNKQLITDLVCLGFKPDERTVKRGAWTDYPRFILYGARTGR